MHPSLRLLNVTDLNIPDLNVTDLNVTVLNVMVRHGEVVLVVIVDQHLYRNDDLHLLDDVHPLIHGGHHGDGHLLVEVDKILLAVMIKPPGIPRRRRRRRRRRVEVPEGRRKHHLLEKSVDIQPLHPLHMILNQVTLLNPAPDPDQDPHRGPHLAHILHHLVILFLHCQRKQKGSVIVRIFFFFLE